MIFLWLYNSNLLRFGKLKMKLKYDESASEYQLKRLDSVSSATTFSLLSLTVSALGVILIIVIFLFQLMAGEHFSSYEIIEFILIIIALINAIIAGFIIGSIIATFYNWIAKPIRYFRFKIRFDKAKGLFQFTHIDARSLGKIFGISNLFIAIPMYVMIISSSFMFFYYLDIDDGLWPILSMVLFPFIFAAVGYFEGLIFGSIYNAISKHNLGVETEIRQVQED